MITPAKTDHSMYQKLTNASQYALIIAIGMNLPALAYNASQEQHTILL